MNKSHFISYTNPLRVAATKSKQEINY